jgi:hypothetical protein
MQSQKCYHCGCSYNHSIDIANSQNLSTIVLNLIEAWDAVLKNSSKEEHERYLTSIAVHREACVIEGNGSPAGRKVILALCDLMEERRRGSQ